MTAREFTHEPDANRYTMKVGGERVCIVDYSINNNAIALTRTFTPPPHRGKGYAGALVEHVVNEIETTTQYRVVPACWYVSDWFERYPERAGILAR
jgi:hypothetical protein